MIQNKHFSECDFSVYVSHELCALQLMKAFEVETFCTAQLCFNARQDLFRIAILLWSPFLQTTVSELRALCSDYIRSHSSDFRPYLTDPNTGDPLTDG